VSNPTHLHYEVVRTLRNRRLLFFTIALPLVLYFAVGSGNRHVHTEGIPFPLYFMTGMAAYGAMFATVSPGARIAADRSRGWHRQARITPLRASTELSAKVVSAYLMVLPTLALLYLAGASLGVRLSSAQWLEMTGLLLVGLAPFVVMGFILGYVVPVDSMPPAMGGLIVLFALFGGAWGSFFNSGAMLTAVKLLPSFWAVQAGKAAVASGSWPVEGWVVVAVWTVVLVPVAVLAYRRSTSPN
jgi:ABC-2 type transport system permease protein